MFKMKKVVLAAVASCLTLTNSVFSMSVFAADNLGNSESSISASEAISGSNGISLDDVKDFYEKIQGNEESSVEATESSTIDYYADDYYDTSGNASLIKSENIIYDSEEMQFIAVTTKDGSVFYVLINYAAEGTEDNVYFLNKVDDYDLYALLYQGDESENNSNTSSAEAAANAADKANSQIANNIQSTAETESTTEAEKQIPNQKSTKSTNTLMIFAVGVIVLAGGGFAVFKLSKGKSKKKSGADDFDGFEDDFDDITTDSDEEE